MAMCSGAGFKVTLYVLVLKKHFKLKQEFFQNARQNVQANVVLYTVILIYVSVFLAVDSFVSPLI